MRVALDYDGTYTTDPATWRKVVKLLIDAGFQVFLCTMRTEEECEDIDPELRALVEIVATHRRAKAEFLAELGLTPNIWIEDQPHFIFQNGAACLPDIDVCRFPKKKLRRR